MALAGAEAEVDFAKMQDTPAIHALKKRMNLDF